VGKGEYMRIEQELELINADPETQGWTRKMNKISMGAENPRKRGGKT
jgi:glycine cleavage system H lipoate-binding protein